MTEAESCPLDGSPVRSMYSYLLGGWEPSSVHKQQVGVAMCIPVYVCHAISRRWCDSVVQLGGAARWDRGAAR